MEEPVEDSDDTIRMVSVYVLLSCLVIQVGGFIHYCLTQYWLSMANVLHDYKYALIFIIVNAVAVWIMYPKDAKDLEIIEDVPVREYLKVEDGVKGVTDYVQDNKGTKTLL